MQPYCTPKPNRQQEPSDRDFSIVFDKALFLCYLDLTSDDHQVAAGKGKSVMEGPDPVPGSGWGGVNEVFPVS